MSKNKQKFCFCVNDRLYFMEKAIKAISNIGFQRRVINPFSIAISNLCHCSNLYPFPSTSCYTTDVLFPFNSRCTSSCFPLRLCFQTCFIFLSSCPESGFLVLICLLFRHKISGFRINCFKFTQYFTKISRLIFIRSIIRESFVTYASKY